MKSFIIFAVVLASFGLIEGGYYGNCQCKDIDSWGWSYGIERDEPVGDSYEGLIVSYEMTDTLELVSYESTYMHATFINNTLSIFTNERFKKFEEEYEASYYSPSMSIEMKLICADNNTDSLELEQAVSDDNTHDPIFNMDVYEFQFGMSIPADYELTKMIPMTIVDKDFLNEYVYVTIDYSEELRVKYRTDDQMGIQTYTGYIYTLKEIKAPFYKEYIVQAMDSEDPRRNSTARIILSVTSNDNNGENNESNENGSDEENENGLHPPVFTKHLYFANYTSGHELQMHERITIKYGAETNTIIKQSGYNEYFRISLNPKVEGALEVIILQTLPDTIMESTLFIVIEIEAENKNLHNMPGRTALIVHLPTNQEKTSLTCSGGAVFDVNNKHSVALIFFLTAIVMIMVMNVVILIWYFQKKKATTDILRVQYPINHITEAVNPIEKIKM